MCKIDWKGKFLEKYRKENTLENVLREAVEPYYGKMLNTDTIKLLRKELDETIQRTQSTDYTIDIDQNGIRDRSVSI